MRRLARALSPVTVLVALLFYCCAALVSVATALAINASVFDASTAGFQYSGAAAFTSHAVDACGVCAGTGATCAGCDGVPNSGAVLDACGVCLQPTDPSFNSTCRGCDRVVNSGATRDACGVCRQLGDGAANSTCAGCDGVPNSNATRDACGVCRRAGDAAANSTCAGCDRVPNSGAVYDACCVCNGNATYLSSCYLALTANGLPKAFDPAINRWADFFSATGQVTYDQCGECVGWGYNNTECAGCDGVPLSGTVYDSCGQCGGNCSTCTAGCGDLGCKLQARTAGPGIHGAPLYTPQNKPGIPPWATAAANIARCVDKVTPNYVVLIYGIEFGPFTLLQLQTGVVNLTDPATQKQVLMPLTPSTLVGVLNATVLNETLTYGATSALPTRAAAWANAAASQTGVIYVTNGTQRPNVVVLSVPITTLVDGTYTPVADIPELRGVAYPACTGVTFRGGAQQTHGKWTGLNPRGIIVSANVTDTDNGLTNTPWNPASQFISDVATTWSDAQCVCHAGWDMSAGPTPPTCPRAWAPSPPVDLRRSAATGTAGGLLRPGGSNGGGGFTMLDGGGKLLNYGSSSTPSRKPWRVTSLGDLRRSATLPADPLGADPPLCRPAARLVPPQARAVGAVWATQAQVPLAGGASASGVTITFRFQFSQAARSCADVATLSRGAFSEEVVLHAHGACASRPAEGLALVLLDTGGARPSGATLGAGGPGLGYAGLGHSLAVEFDARGNVSAGEPANAHVAVLTAGAAPNSELHHVAALAATDDVAPFTDGTVHTASVTFVAQPSGDALAAGLSAGGSFRAAGKGGAVLRNALSGAGPVGLMQVFLDDLTTPVVSLPLAPGFFLQSNGTGAVWVGFTAANGDGWSAVDVLSVAITS